MKRMKMRSIITRFLSAGLITLCLILGHTESFATHIVGGDLTYTCMGDGQYEITLTLRRDCVFGDPEAFFDDPASIGIFTGTGSLVTALGEQGELLLPFVSADTINIAPEEACIYDQGDVCVQETVYKGSLHLPFRNGGYILAYQRCCRNQTLLNILDPLETGGTYVARFSEATLETCNSSATFEEWPDIFICAGQPLDFNHGATDPDGDQLVYKLCTPTAGATITDPIPQPPNRPTSTSFPYYGTITWSGGFSDANMLGSGDPLTIDPNTGQLTAVPGAIGQYLVGVCVEEWRDGKIINIVRRDFEYNIVPCEDPLIADFDFEGTDCDELSYTFTNTSPNGVDPVWNFDWPSTDPAVISDEDMPTYTFPAEGTYQVAMEVTSENIDCEDQIVKEITIVQGGFDLDFDLSLSECGENNLDIVLEAGTTIYDPSVSVDQFSWEAFLDGESFSTGEGATFTIEDVFFEDLEIVLTGTSNKGCEKTITKSFTIMDLLPEADFEVVVLQCYANGFQFQAMDISASLNDQVPEMWMWTISDVSNSTMLMGQTVTFDALSPVTIELEVKFDNGCYAFVSKTIDPLEDLAPEVVINTSVSGCDFENNMIDVELDVDLIGGSFAGDPISYDWTILENNETTNLEGEMVSYTYNNTENDLEISVLVTYDNGCQFSKTMTYSSEDLLPQITLVYDNVVCHPDGTIDVDITASFDAVSGFSPMSFDWIITNDGTQMFSGQTISVTLQDDQALNIDLTVSFENGCVINLNEDVDLAGDILPDPSWEVVITDCDDPTNLTVEITNTTDYDAELVSLTWTYIINGTSNSSSDDPLVLNVSIEDDISLTLLTVYDNGCSGETTENPLDIGYPSVEFFGDPLLVCMGMPTQIVSNPNSDWTYTWDPTTGLSFDDPSDQSNPTVTVTEDITYSVTVTNGACTITDEIDVTVTLESEITIDGAEMVCDGVFELSVSNPVNGGQYVWADDPDFTNIIGTGTSITGTIPNGEDTYTVYVQLDGDNEECLVGIATIELIDNSIDVDIIEPFMLCYGDTAQYIILNNDPSQVLEFQWNDSHIVEGADTNTPVIGVGFEDEEFEMEVTITNQFGCSVTDFVTVIVGEAMDLAFGFEYEECGDLTVCFTPAGNPGNLYTWDFGDPASGSDNQAVGSEVCHTFTDEGAFTVSLTGVGAICSGNSYSETIEIFNDIDILNLGVEVDELAVCLGDSLVFAAVTNGDADDISWCFDGGVVIGQGAEITVLTGSGTDDLVWVVNGQEYESETITAKINASDDCVLTDEVNIDIYDFGPGTEIEDLSFEVMYEDCGGATVCFEANTDAAGFLEWDFGDGNTASGDQNICHTYELPATGSGTFDVTVSAPDAPCDVNAFTMTIVVSEEPFVTVLGAEENGIINFCFGDTLLLEATTNADMGDIQWCNADGDVVETGPTYTWVGEGEETISVKLDGGDDCIDTTLVNLIPYDFGPGTENDTLDFTAMLEDCGGSVVCFEANTAAAGFLVWDFGDGSDPVVGDQFPCHDYALTGSGTFTVTLSAPDAPCDVEPISQEITIFGVDPMIDIDVESDTLNYCFGDTITVTATSNLPDDNVSWCSPIDVEIASGNSFTYSGEDGILVYVKVDDGLGCSDVDSVYIEPFDFGPGTENDTLFFEAFRPDCSSSVVCFEANTAADGNLIWDFGDGSDLVFGDQFPCHEYDVALTGSGTFEVMLSAPDAPCPVVAYADSITVLDFEPTLEIDTMFNDCINDIYTVIASTNIDAEAISWCDSTGTVIETGSVLEIPINESTVITAKVTDGLGCGDTIQLVLEPQMMDSLFIDLSDQDCSGDEFTIGVNGTNAENYDYEWGPAECFTGDINGQFTTIDADSVKTVFVTVTDPGSGCTMVLDTIVLPGLEELDISIISSVGDTLCLGEEVTLTLTPYDETWEVEWSTGDTDVGEITDSPEEDTEYIVTITDANGCEIEVSLFLTVTLPTCTEDDVYLPNAFSPNGDNVNDILLVRSKFIDEMELKIVNRWGQIVFQTTDPAEGWDGTYQGEELAPDAFAYWLRVTCINGTDYETQGNVSIIR